jgi:hypothetical protein
LFGNPFKDEFIRLLGTEMSLDNIDHDTIRADGALDDPRIHFATNCASVGCPMRRNKPYRSDRLDAQLEEQTVRFPSDKAGNRYNAASKALEVSRIFSAPPWYGGGFKRGWKGSDTLEAYFARYANVLAARPDDRRLVRDHKPAIRYLDYDWALNSPRS